MNDEMNDELMQAVTCHRDGRLEEAERRYQDVLQQKPDHAEAHHNLGALLLQRGDQAAALPHFLAALESDSSNGQYWIGYIDALHQSGQTDAAIEVLNLARGQGLQGEQVEELAARLAARPSNREIDALIALFGQGRLAEAAGAATELTRRYPDHEFGWKALGAVFKQQGHPQDALLPMQKAAELAPEDVEAHYNLGVTLQELARLTEAKDSYLRALEIDPNYADAYGNLGVVQQSLGEDVEAEESYRRAVSLKPSYASAHYNLGCLLAENKDFATAEASLRRALQLSPDDAQCYSRLGDVLKAQQRQDEAADCYERALSIKPDNAHLHYNLGNLYKDMGRLAEAESSYRSALRIAPDFAQAHYNLGAIAQDRGDLAAAEAGYLKAVEVDPGYVDAHYNLGNVYKAQGRLEDACSSYRRAIEHNPEYSAAHYNLANVLGELGRLDEAEACYRTAIGLAGDYLPAYCNLGNLLTRIKKFGEAAECFEAALAINPDYADAHYNLGNTLREIGRLADAEHSYRLALSIRPDFAEGYGNLGVTLLSSGRVDEAIACFRRAIEIKPDHAQAYCSLGSALQRRGELDEAISCFRRAVEIKPDYSDAHSNLIFTLDLSATADMASLSQERLRWAAQHANALRQHRAFANLPDPARRLRVGYVSADFRMHSAAYAFGAMLTAYDRDNFDIYAYSNLLLEDHLTRQFQQHVSCWRNIFGLSDAAVAEMIRDDKIDILVDLSGHSAGNRLLVFARKPAPIQITAWGYAAGTGMSAMDVLFSDPVFVPPEEQRLYAEKIVYLPSAIGYFMPGTPPAVNALPASSNGFVTFGSFNRLAKLTDQSFLAWADVLRSVPGSRLILKTPELDEASARERVLGHFAGIAAERISLLGKTSRDEHLAAYNLIDIALDPFPHGGGVTALEGLMMGVPFVTLQWPTLTGRVSASIATSLGFTDWIAKTRSQYVQIAAAKAGDLPALAMLRAQLPGRFASSIIGDKAAYVGIAEQQYRKLWREWCEKASAPDAPGS